MRLTMVLEQTIDEEEVSPEMKKKAQLILVEVL